MTIFSKTPSLAIAQAKKEYQEFCGTDAVPQVLFLDSYLLEDSQDEIWRASFFETEMGRYSDDKQEVQEIFSNPESFKLSITYDSKPENYVWNESFDILCSN